MNKKNRLLMSRFFLWPYRLSGIEVNIIASAYYMAIQPDKRS